VDSKITTREVVIIAVLILTGIWFMGSRADGPVEKVAAEIGLHSDQAPADEHNHTHDSPHGDMSGQVLEPSDGTPFISLGNYVIGDQWFIQALEIRVREYQMNGSGEEMARELATEDVLLIALQELIILKYIDDLEAVPDQDVMDSRRERFTMETDDGAHLVEVLALEGMTMEQLESRWEIEAVMVDLENKIFEIEGIDPESPDAGMLFHEWLTEMINASDLEFADQALRALYEDKKINGWDI